MAKGPTWFKIHSSYKTLLDNIESRYVGDGLKLALSYLVYGEEPPNDISPMTNVVFTLLRGSVDESIDVYAAKVEGGKFGASARAQKMSKDNYR